MRRTFVIVFIFLITVIPVLVEAANAPKVEFKKGANSVDVMIAGKLFTSYRHTPEPDAVKGGILQTKPALHPVMSPSGVAVTRTYPFGVAEGEATDHPHHMGIYFTIDRVGSEDNNFWGNSKQPLPAIKHVKIVKSDGGEGKGVLSTLSEWVGKDGQAVLNEHRDMVFRVIDPATYAIDFEIALEPAKGEVSFGDTKEGMFAFRVAQFLTDKQTGRYLNSEGGEGEQGVWGKRARWVRLQGEKDGKKIAIAILDHPKSTNSPTYWHARGYGCFSVNPLGQLDFQKAHKEPEPKEFGLKLKPGQKALFKYRVLVHEGELGKEQVEKIYESWAK